MKRFNYVIDYLDLVAEIELFKVSEIDFRKLVNVTKIVMIECKIPKLHVDNQTLQEFHAVNNGICSFSICCPELVIMDVSYNQIRDVGLITFCPKLRSLNISNNKLTCFENLFQFPEIRSLDISNNRLIKLLDYVINFDKLETLKCNDNYLDKLDNINNLPSLVFVDLSFNRVKTLHIKSVHTVIISKNELVSLDVDDVVSLTYKDATLVYTNRMFDKLQKYDIIPNLTKHLYYWQLIKPTTCTKSVSRTGIFCITSKHFVFDESPYEMYSKVYELISRFKHVCVRKFLLRRLCFVPLSTIIDNLKELVEVMFDFMNPSFLKLKLEGIRRFNQLLLNYPVYDDFSRACRLHNIGKSISDRVYNTKV